MSNKWFLKLIHGIRHDFISVFNIEERIHDKKIYHIIFLRLLLYSTLEHKQPEQTPILCPPSFWIMLKITIIVMFKSLFLINPLFLLFIIRFLVNFNSSYSLICDSKIL